MKLLFEENIKPIPTVRIERYKFVYTYFESVVNNLGFIKRINILQKLDSALQMFSG